MLSRNTPKNTKMTLFQDSRDINHQQREYAGYQINASSGFTKKQRDSVDYYRKEVSRNSAQTPKIQQLRQQYEILRDLPVNGVQRNKGGDQSLLSYSSSKQSLKNSSSESITNSHHHQNSYNMYMLEKQQLQLVISNSMKKIEQLLKKQVDYKNRIHELEMQGSRFKNRDAKSEEDSDELRKFKRKEAEYEQEIVNLKNEMEAILKTLYLLQEKYKSVELELQSLEEENQELRQKMRETEENLAAEKSKNAELQIKSAKAHRQFQILQRNFKQEMAALSERSKVYHPMADNHELIEQLQKKLQYAEHKYSILLREFQKPEEPSENPPKSDRSNSDKTSQMIYNLLLRIRQESENNRANSINILKDVLTSLNSSRPIEVPVSPSNQKNTALLLDEIMQLRREVKELKNTENKEKKVPVKNFCRDHMFKIEQLRQKLEVSGKKNSQLTVQYENLSKNHSALKNLHEVLSNEHQILQEELEKAKKYGFTLEEIRKKFRDTEMGLEETIHNLKKAVDDANFKNIRLQKQKEFEIGHIRANHQSQINALKMELQRNNRQKMTLRAELDKMKAFYDGKMREKNQMVEKIISEYSALLQSNEHALHSFKSSNEKEISELIKKLKDMEYINDQYRKSLNRNAYLQREIADLKNSIPSIRGLNENVEHLWVVKETEYKNLNEILNDVRRDDQ